MSVSTETGEEPDQLLMQHRMVIDGINKLCFLLIGGEFSIQKQIADFHEIALHRQLLNRVASVQEQTFVAIDKRNGGFGAGSGEKARVIGEHATLGIKCTDVDCIRPHTSRYDR